MDVLGTVVVGESDRYVCGVGESKRALSVVEVKESDRESEHFGAGKSFQPMCAARSAFVASLLDRAPSI